MTDLRLPYINAFKDRHGSPRYYFRFKGQRWALPAPGEPGFAAAYEALKARVNDSVAAKVAFLPGSLGWAIEKFTGSDDYKSRGAKTRANERRVFDELRREYGTGLLRDLTPRHVKLIRNAMRETFSTSTADLAIGLLSLTWDYADENLDLDGLDANPTTGVKRIHKHGDGHEPWPEGLIERFERDAIPAHLLALHLLLYTGQRRSDVVKMKWSQFDGQEIEVKQQKTGEPLIVPCHAILRETLSRTPHQSEFILVGERGRPLMPEALSASFRRRLEKMGVKGYSVHGLRKNAGVALADAGCDVRDIMAILGHRSVAMAMHYTKRADQKRRARAAMGKWEAASTSKEARRR
jgi:integrase